MNAQVNAVFNAFVEAQKAMDTVPVLEAELQKTNAQLARSESELEFNREKVTARDETIAALQSKIAEMEASLDSATKSGKEMSDRLSVVVDALRGVTKSANEAVELVAPTPVPVAEPTPVQPVASAEPVTDLPSTFRPWDSSYPSKSKQNRPFAVPASSTNNTNELGRSSEDGVVDTDPDGLAYQRQNWPGQSDAHPTVASEPSNQWPDAPTVSAAPSGSARQYEGQSYWDKPSDMSYDEWASKGGETPPWYRNRSA